MSEIRRITMALGAIIVAALSLTLVSLVAAPAAVAGAQTGTPIEEYASYPAPLPDGCPDGARALIGVIYDNGRGGRESDLRRLDLRNGDTLTMTWDEYAPGCTTTDGAPAIAVSMAAYDAGAGTFDPAIDQLLLPGWTSCGLGQQPCTRTDAGYRLSVTLPGTEVSCNIQTGAVIGPPLATVGPNGSYYRAVMRGDDRPTMLIGAANFATSPCPPPTTAAPVVVAAATTTTTVRAAVAGIEVTQAPTSAPATTTTIGTQVEAATASLPATGRGDGGLVLVGVGALAVGALLLGLRRTTAAGRGRSH